jgi:4-hydroxybenzoate polyprenyltransferase
LERAGQSPVIEGLNYWLLSAASVLIAAAGYIINDYFDINIDLVNKPSGNVVDSVISRRWAIMWHFILSFSGVLLSAYVSWKTGMWFYCYSKYYLRDGFVWLFGYVKKEIVIGNILISLLTAWVLLLLHSRKFESIACSTPVIWDAYEDSSIGISYMQGFAFLFHSFAKQ